MIFVQYKTSTPSINYAGICKSCFLMQIVSFFTPWEVGLQLRDLFQLEHLSLNEVMKMDKRILPMAAFYLNSVY